MINDENIQFVIKKPICDGIGNVIKSFITAYSVNDNTKIHCNPDFVFGNYETIFDKSHIFDDHDELYPNRQVEYMYTSRLLVLSTEDDEQQHIFSDENMEVNGCGNLKYNYLYSFKCLIDWNYDPSRLCEKLKNRILNCIRKIRTQPYVYSYALSLVLSNVKQSTLGISVRTWKCFHEQNINRPYNFETYQKTIEHVMTQNPDIENILLSLDNYDVEPQYMEYLASFGKPVVVLRKTDDINELQYAFIKMLTLSKCKYFIGNRISTFTELVFWFGECKPKVYPVF